MKEHTLCRRLRRGESGDICNVAAAGLYDTAAALNDYEDADAGLDGAVAGFDGCEGAKAELDESEGTANCIGRRCNWAGRLLSSQHILVV